MDSPYILRYGMIEKIDYSCVTFWLQFGDNFGLNEKIWGLKSA